MESRKISRRLSRGAHGRDRRKSGSRWKRDRREAEESAKANQGDRSRFSFATKLGENRRREENIDGETSRQTRASREKGGVAVAAVYDRRSEIIRRSQSAVTEEARIS